MQDSLRMLPLPLHSLKVPQVDPFNHIHFYLYCKMLCIYVTCRKIFLANNFKSVLTKNTKHLKCPLKMISMKMCSFSPHFCSDNTLAVLQPGGILAYPNSQHKATPRAAACRGAEGRGHLAAGDSRGRWLCPLGVWQPSITGVLLLSRCYLTTRPHCGAGIHPLQVQRVQMCISNKRSGCV